MPITITSYTYYMGINLCSVESVSWTELEDGMLGELTIEFIPTLDEK